MSISLKEGDWPKLSQIIRRFEQQLVEYTPRRISQSGQPTTSDVSLGEMIIWHDTDDSKVYWLYNDADVGIVKVEMT